MNRSNELWRALALTFALPLLSAASCPPRESAGWLLANRRDHPLTLTLRRTEQCERGRRVLLVEGAEDDDLSQETAFGPAERVVVRAQDKIWLHYESVPNGVAPQGCGAIWISAEGEFDLVLAWDALPNWESEADTTPYSVIVEGPKHALVLHVPAGLEQLPPPGAKLLWPPEP